MKPVVFHPEAEEEFDAAIAYYEQQRRGSGLVFKSRSKPGLRQFK